ncbi:MAG: GNAT family N-acetyltransferase [Ginsengibacter sp.]
MKIITNEKNSLLATPTYHIDFPQPADFSRLLTVWEASVRATHHFVPEEKIKLLKTLIQEQELFQKSELFCVRDLVGEVAGFAGVAGDSLDMLFLDPSIIGTGAGKTLIRYAIDVKGITRVDVNEQNDQARGFYEHFGFKVIGRSETDDNGQPFPLLHMRRIIDDLRPI